MYVSGGKSRGYREGRHRETQTAGHQLANVLAGEIERVIAVTFFRPRESLSWAQTRRADSSRVIHNGPRATSPSPKPEPAPIKSRGREPARAPENTSRKSEGWQTVAARSLTGKPALCPGKNCCLPEIAWRANFLCSSSLDHRDLYTIYLSIVVDFALDLPASQYATSSLRYLRIQPVGWDRG